MRAGPFSSLGHGVWFRISSIHELSYDYKSQAAALKNLYGLRAGIVIVGLNEDEVLFVSYLLHPDFEATGETAKELG